MFSMIAQKKETWLLSSVWVWCGRTDLGHTTWAFLCVISRKADGTNLDDSILSSYRNVAEGFSLFTFFFSSFFLDFFLFIFFTCFHTFLFFNVLVSHGFILTGSTFWRQVGENTWSIAERCMLLQKNLSKSAERLWWVESVLDVWLCEVVRDCWWLHWMWEERKKREEIEL